MYNTSLLNNLAKYYRDLLFALSTHAGKHFVDIKAGLGYGLTADLSLFIPDIEQIITNGVISFTIEKTSPQIVDEIIKKASEFEDEEEQSERGQDKLLEQLDISIEEMEKKNASATLVAIYRKQQFDPYNRETIIGFPIITGRIENKRICAPLFYYKVNIDFDPLKGLITLTKNLEIPALNFQLINQLIESDEEREMIRQKILPHLYQEDFGLSTIQEIIQRLSNLVEIFKGIKYSPKPSSLKEALELRDNNGFKLLNTSVIVNAKRTHAHLLDDLTHLTQIEEIGDETVVKTILSEPVDGGDSDEIDIIDPGQERPILFPLLNNKAQRIAAIKADQARLLVIQGPPGTGKSQTIANLICHLIAQGKTVLMTSHQNKALEVVTKILPPIDYLAMSLLKGERESINELRNKIESFSSYVSGVDINRYKKLLENQWSELRKINDDIKRLEVRFSELKILERELYPIYHKYHKIRNYNIIDPNDSIPDGKDSQVATALKEYSTLMQKLRDYYFDIESIFSLLSNNPVDENCIISIEVAIENIKQFINAVEWIKNNLFANQDILVFCQQFSQLSKDLESSESINFLDALIQWLDKYCNELIASKKLLSELYNLEIDFQVIKKQITEYEIEDILKCVDSLKEKLKSLKESIPDDSFPEFPDNLLLEEMNSHLEILSATSNSWLRWHLSRSARNSRRFFVSNGLPRITYNNRTEFLDKVKAWHRYWTLRNQIMKDFQFLSELNIPIKDLSQKPALSELYKNLNLAQRYSQIMVAVGSFPAIYSDKIKSFIEHRMLNISNFEDIPIYKEWLEKTKVYLEICKSLDKLRSNSHITSSLISSFEKTIYKLCFDKEEDKYFNKLTSLYPYFYDYKELKTLECTFLKTLPRTCSKIKRKILEGNSIPALENPDLVVEAFRLSAFMRYDLLKNPDDINEVAKKINSLKKELQEKILKILDTNRKIALKEADLSNPTREMINKLRHLLRRKRKTYSFVQLRDQIDYKRLLSVFPCWIMSIEDVSRIFPLEPGLFDYLIVDEASQCNQATALHLAYRAKRMIVVGDDKQMKNPNTQFLSDTVVRLNLTKYNLDNHHRAVFFHGKNSLLDLAIGCQDISPVFLNEHFRCEPPIIEFSNRHFYNGQLKILTPFRRKRFNPCMEIRLVRGAYDDPDDTKQNIVEARAVIEELKRMIKRGELEGDKKGEKLSVGILSLFRRQAALLQSMIYETFENTPNIIKEYDIIVSTVDGFQGDERDVIFYSFRYAPNSKPGTINVLQRGDEHTLGRLNVAFSRARRKVVCFISVPPENFPRGLIRDYLIHVKSAQTSLDNRLGNPNEREKCQSDFERDVLNELIKRGLNVYAQVPCAGFFMDFVVIDKDGRRMAVECDGEFHFDEYGELREEDYQRQDIIERNGWFVHRISSRKFYANPQRAIDKLIEELQKQEPDQEVSVAEGPPKTFAESIQIIKHKNDQKGEFVSENVEKLVPESMEEKIIAILSEEGPMPLWKIAQKIEQPKERRIPILEKREEIIPALEKLLEKGWVINYYKNGVKMWEAIPKFADKK